MTFEELQQTSTSIWAEHKPTDGALKGHGYPFFIRNLTNQREYDKPEPPYEPIKSCWSCVYFTFTPSDSSMSIGVCDLLNEHPVITRKYNTCDYYEDNKTDVGPPERSVYIAEANPFSIGRE